MAGLVKSLFRMGRDKHPEPGGFIEPSPPPPGEYPENAYPELTPYPYFLAGQPPAGLELKTGGPPLTPQQELFAGGPTIDQQTSHPPSCSPAPTGSKTQPIPQRPEPFDFIPEVSEPTSENFTTHKRGFELGTRPPPVPPKSPLGEPEDSPVRPDASAQWQEAPLGQQMQRHSFEGEHLQKRKWPKPPSSQITENSAVLIERHRELIQRHAARKVEPWMEKQEPFVGDDKAVTPPKSVKGSTPRSKHQPTMSLSAIVTGQHPPSSSVGYDSVMSRGARRSSYDGGSGRVFSGEVGAWDPQPLTAENLSLFSQQPAKPIAFRHPAKRGKARKSGKSHKKKSSRSKDATRSDRVREPKSAEVTAKPRNVDELFDNTEFDVLDALDKVDQYRSRGPEEDNIAHKHTLAMLSATEDRVKDNSPDRDVPTQAQVDEGCRDGTDCGPCGPDKANTSGDLDTAGELNTSAEVKKNLHQSFNTTTTESFGHIYHRDGRPVPPPLPGPSQRFSHQKHNSGGGLADISEAAESKAETRDRRLVMVEDVPDVDLPMRSPGVSTASPLKHQAAKDQREGSEMPELLDSQVLQPEPAAASNPASAAGADSSSSPSQSSDAGTSFTQMRGLVDRSSFHDEVLCQLIDAIHNRLIGEEAQKALIRAAKARVIELKAMKARGEEIMLSPPHFSTKTLKINKKKSSKPSEETAKSLLEPPPMTREPSSGQDQPSVLHTPTEERSPQTREGSGLKGQDEARINTPQDWAKKIQNDLQQSFKNFGFKRQPRSRGQDKRKHKASRSTGSTAPSTTLPSLHATPFTTGPNPTPMQRDPTPDRATFPASTFADRSLNTGCQGARSQPFGTSFSHPHNPCCPSHVPSASWSGPCNAHMTPAFEHIATPVGQPHTTCCPGHAPTTSWSGPYGAHMAPAFGQPHNMPDPAFTRPEVARPSEGLGVSPNGGPGNRPGPVDSHQAGADLLEAMFREERYSLPVSDEELRSAAEFVNGTRRPFIVPLGIDLHQTGVVLEFPEHPSNHFQRDAPWSKSASIHTIYDETTKEETPTFARPPDTVPSSNLASPIPPPGAMPPLGLGTAFQMKAESEVSCAPTVPPKDEAKPEAEEVKTPRVTDIHLPATAAEPAITLEPPTTTDLTAATSKENSSPVASGNSHTDSNSMQNRPEWDLPVPVQKDERESFPTAHSQPQLPAYQSQPTSPSKVVLPGSDAKGYFPETRGVSSDTKISGGHAPQPGKEKKQEENQEGPGRTETSLSAASPRMPHAQLPGQIPRGVDSMRSPDTMTTTFTLSGPLDLKPPDIITERLYAWAGEKAEHDFVETLERLSGGEEIRELPLTVFTLQTWKRYVKVKLERAPGECERLLVPPEICDSINRAVQAKDYNDAASWLLQAWAPFGRERAPRLIISLHRHGVQDTWFANRYDIPSHRMLSYLVSSSADEPGAQDYRPHLWWNAIARAWPDLALPDAETEAVAFKFTSTPVLERRREDASTRAAVVARNLLLSYDPLHEYDLVKLRELIMAEVSRLLDRKRRGKLRVWTRSSKTSS